MINSLKKNFFSKLKSDKGFSLIEVLIALGIISSALMVLTSSWTSNFRRVGKAKIQTQVVYLLQKKMIEIETLYESRPQDLPTEDQKGDFGKEYKRYSFVWKSQEFKMPDLTAAFTTQEGGTDELTLTVVGKMREYFESAVKEVSVTVFYRRSPKAKPLKYTISRLFVDYSVNIDLGIDASLINSLGGGGN